MNEQLSVRAARAEDVPAITLLIREFAEFEKLIEWCDVTDADLHAALFGAGNFVRALVALDGNRYAGYALYYPVFKSFRGEQSIFLEDLYVTPDLRGQGLGLVMLREVAHYARENNFARMDWQALQWNEPAIDFYKRLGAEADDSNLDFRLRGDAFLSLSE
ncbi:MAG: GNAT family N-acetyltransferase [Acidobacteriota bacterium]|nr:GNAT family N-acetyltransferase [Acidobacteriota bacterium]